MNALQEKEKKKMAKDGGNTNSQPQGEKICM
jgi:hypothetical protein